MMVKWRSILASGIPTVALAATALVSPASATADGSGPQPSVEEVTSSTAAASFTDTCFGYTGTFKSGTHILRVDWQLDGSIDECFGVAPNRTIWHAWRNSGAWREMPNHGLADDMYGWSRDSAGRRVKVWVNFSGTWCSTFTSSWQPWVRC